MDAEYDDSGSPEPRTSDPVLLFRQGVAACLPTIPGYWSIGFASGAIGALAGFSTLDVLLLSGLLYAGSAQFMVYSLHAAGAGVVGLVLGVLLVNMRYLLMSSWMAMHFTRAKTLEKIIGGALLTDETFGVAAQYAGRHGTLPFAWLLGLNLSAWLNWIVANLVGVWLASALPESLTKGLSFSLVAMFVGLLLSLWFASRRKALETATILLAMGAAALTFEGLGANAAALLATLFAASAATLLLRLRRKEGEA